MQTETSPQPIVPASEAPIEVLLIDDQAIVVAAVRKMLDGNADKAGELAWRAVKPSGARSLVNHSEAVA